MFTELYSVLRISITLSLRFYVVCGKHTKNTVLVLGYFLVSGKKVFFCGNAGIIFFSSGSRAAFYVDFFLV